MKKQIGFKTKGMNRDLSVSAFNPEFAFENMNLRLSTNENNTLMSWVNEKGTSPISLSDSNNNQVILNGCVIGTAILNKYLVLFLTNGCVATEGNVQYFDSIYRLEYKSGDDARITMTATKLYDGLESGNLGFSIEHPLETIVSYESDSIQKVYWTDGINQPRLINISPENDENTSSYSSTSFDFIPTLQLNETIKVKKILGGGGMFAPGVIQYAFTYYNKYMQESNIFYTTPLHYISYADRGASPEDKVDNVFKITIEDYDDNFEYLRIYSIQRTSINGTPICKRIQDIELSSISGRSVSFTDTGTVGESIDPTELLYKGGRDILVGTMEHKDGTLFMGDITTSNERPNITLNAQNTPLESVKRTFYPAFVSSNNYEYANQLTSYKAKELEGGEFEKTNESVPCAGFKNGNIYRCGVQFQDKTGRWTDPILIDNYQVNQSPDITVNVHEDPAGKNNCYLHELIVTNNSEYTIIPSNTAYFALKYTEDGETIKRKFTVKLGEAGSYSIAQNMSQYFSKAYIEDGIKPNSANLRFCSKAEAIALGMDNNVQLIPENPSLRDYVLDSIAEGTLISDSSTYTINCTESQDPTPQPVPGEDVYREKVTFSNLVTAFAGIIGKTIPSGSAAYSYLESMYDAANTEYNDSSSLIFDSNTYKEIYNYHGNVSTYEILGYNAMMYWLMAICLSELVPTFGVDSNNQTLLFKYAYDTCDGSKIPLYGNYTIKGDPMIMRYAAAAIYAKNHNAKISSISQARTSLQGSTIQGSAWEDLGYVGDSTTPMSNLGYIVNTKAFLPKAPGPFVSGYDSSLPKNQSADLFYDTSRTNYWERLNYKKDVEIDDHVVSTYIMYDNENNHVLKTPTNAAEKEINTRILEAATIPDSSDFAYFGKRRVLYTRTDEYTAGGNDIAKHKFSETSDSPTDTNQIYDIVGPFQDLEAEMFSGTTSVVGADGVTYNVPNRTEEMIRISKFMTIADNCRFPTMQGTNGNGTGRIRPLGGESGSGTRAAHQYDAIGGLQNGPLMALFADDSALVPNPDKGNRTHLDDLTTDSIQDDYPGDGPKSYPSGHSSQVWFLAMYLSQTHVGNLINYMKNAYRFSENRSVGRYHWSSDCMYGRLFGTMILPIINAMNEGGGGTTNPIINVNITITNSTSSSITLDGDMALYVGNPDSRGVYNGWAGPYNQTTHFNFSNAAVTIGSGESRTFNNCTPLLDANNGIGFKRPATQEEISDSGSARNVKLYIGGISEIAVADNLNSNIVFENGGTYTVNISSYNPPAATRGLMKTTKSLARGVGDSENTDLKVTVPIIKGTLSSENAASLYRDGYRRARAVVVYPDMQNRNVVCQGVGSPAVYTEAGRGANYSDEYLTKDTYAQSSWFFRPYYSKNSYREDANVPSFKNTEDDPTIQYIDYTEENNAPDAIKKVEVQGAFFFHNRFRVDWKTLTFHTPDLEFDDAVQTLDFKAGGLGSYWIGNAQVVRTFSDIDIQTETPTIDSNASGFIKKSFVKGDAAGIIAGLFYEDFAVNDGTEENELKFESFKSQNAAMKWMVYPWNKGGSLNNDIERPAGFGVSSAVLKQKIISNLRFANSLFTDFEEGSEPQDLKYNIHLFSSDQNEVIKLKGAFTFGTDIYRGNIDTLLVPDKSYGMYFALSNPPDADDITPPSFTSQVSWMTYAKKYAKGKIDDKGCYYYSSEDGVLDWRRDNSTFGKDLGDEYPGLVLKKDSVRMKYKSTPHLVLVEQDTFDSGGVSYDNMNDVSGLLPIIELRRNLSKATAFGGDSKDTLREQVWIPCGEPVKLWDGRKDEHDNPVYDNVDFYYEWGDTYYQRWDCLKTYAFTPEDINQVVEIGSFMLETYVNIDGRYDRNRGQQSNLYMSPQNFNLLNPVYSQINNFFSYKVQDDDAYDDKKFPNQITWSKTKTSGADVDLWTNVTLASILEMDGDKGSIRKLIRANDQLLCFQDGGVSQVLYNENTQISTTEGVPIEIANSGKVQGKRYISDTIGCSNKWSLTQTPAGIYFMDSINKAIFMYNGQLNNLSSSYGMNAWCKDSIPDDSVIWTPSDYMIDNGTAGEERIFGFQNFVTYYDKLNQDVLFINKEKALAFSEKLGTFTSFYNYEESPYFCNLQDTGIWLKVAVEEEGDMDIPDHLEYTTSLWKHQAGSYCKFFGENKPYWMILVGNPEPQLDKIFTNLEFRACVDGDGEMETVVPEGGTEPVETGRFIPALPFTDLETWNEYQHGKATLSNKWGHAAFMHPRNGDFSIKRKFRIWRCDIPRSNAPLTADAGLNCYRKEYRPNDRMRNPWLYLKLMKQAAASNKEMDRTEIHDIIMTYFG